MKVTFRNVVELAEALKSAQNDHHIYEQQIGEPDADWQTWYAQHIFAHNTKEN